MHNDSEVNHTRDNGSALDDAEANARLVWSRWWCYGCLQQADKSWCDGRIAERDMALAALQHAALCRRLNLPATLPPAPQPALLQLAQLNARQRERVLILIASVCRESVYPLPEALTLWCRRLAKALRPGMWLPAALNVTPLPRQAALAILSCRFPEICGSRLQLLYPCEMGYPREAQQPDMASWRDSVPLGRVSALCDAIIWKAADEAAFAGKTPHLDTQHLDRQDLDTQHLDRQDLDTQHRDTQHLDRQGEA
ncbi:serine kinase [Dickeya lacustris]|uniref:Serine kinase n=1 Tax=Dickeya lacustris TaxID=2259638 RepID=A0ABY8G8E0_9GAMM|nr:serine kinase [Dickeya lacustris]WFN56238.1 serine kinase [Dickeya lacustris]